MKRALENVDSKFWPRENATGWQYYDKVLAAYWTLLLSKYEELSTRSATHFCSEAFGVQESTIKQLAKELKEVDSSQNTTDSNKEFIYYTLMLITLWRLALRRVNPQALSPRSKNNQKVSVEKQKAVSDVFSNLAHAAGWGAVESLKDLLESSTTLVDMAISESEKIKILEGSKSKKYYPLGNDLTIRLLVIKLLRQVSPRMLNQADIFKF